MSNTTDLDNANAATLFADEMAELYARFLDHIPQGGLILVAGCGAGRDCLAFLALGYRVKAFDASYRLAQLASHLIKQPVTTRTLNQVDEIACYDGIWASASFLHLCEDEVIASLQRLWSALKPEGVCYVNFKLCDGERNQDGYHFTEVTESRVRAWSSLLTNVKSVECWITKDQQPGCQENWIYAIICRNTSEPAKLITGEREHPFPEPVNVEKLWDEL